jgi:rhodanese-related sulfurtransferase
MEKEQEFESAADLAELETNRRKEEEEIADARTPEGIESNQRSIAGNNAVNITMETEETFNQDREQRIIFKC